MNFIDGLTYIYKNKKDESEINNPFYIYSRLSDLCNNSFIEKEKVKNYWKVTSQINIIQILLEKGTAEGLYILKSLFFELKDIPYSVYKECVYYSIKVVDPSFHFKSKTNNIIQETKKRKDERKYNKNNIIANKIRNMIKRSVFIHK